MEERVRYLWTAGHSLADQAPTVARLLMRELVPVTCSKAECPVSLQTRCCSQCGNLLTPGKCTVRIVSRRKRQKKKRHGKTGPEYRGSKSSSFLKIHCRVCKGSFYWPSNKPKPPSISSTISNTVATPQPRPNRNRRRHSLLKWKLEQSLSSPATPTTPSLSDFLLSP